MDREERRENPILVLKSKLCLNCLLTWGRAYNIDKPLPTLECFTHMQTLIFLARITYIKDGENCKHIWASPDLLLTPLSEITSGGA